MDLQARSLYVKVIRVEDADYGVTDYLLRWNQDSQGSLDQIYPLVAQELRRLAASFLAQETSSHTLQATALVHELYLRLRQRRTINWRDRGHFFGFAARTMRRILVDHARTRGRQKRGGGAAVVEISEALDCAVEADVDLVALDEALEALRQLDERQHQIVELRFFAGLTSQEIAEMMNLGTATVQRQWASARAWLYQYLQS